MVATTRYSWVKMLLGWPCVFQRQGLAYACSIAPAPLLPRRLSQFTVGVSLIGRKIAIDPEIAGIAPFHFFRPDWHMGNGSILWFDPLAQDALGWPCVFQRQIGICSVPSRLHRCCRERLSQFTVGVNRESHMGHFFSTLARIEGLCPV